VSPEACPEVIVDRYCPFDVAVDTVAAFVNAELSDHPVYDGFEVQWFDDPEHGTGMLAFLQRRQDRRVDYYVQPGLEIDRSGFELGAGTGQWVEGRVEAGPHDVDPIFLHQGLLRLHVHTLPFHEEMLQPRWRHAYEQQTGLCPDVLEGMDVIARQEDERAGRRVDELFAELELELPFQDIEELVLSPVDVGGRATPGRHLDAEDAKRTLGALARGQDLDDVCFSPHRP
jgi:hypothetical protein